MQCSGRVYIVGAGPGDPELITVKGLKLIREADVIVYDRLIPRELLEEAKPGAKLIYAGKRPGMHAMTQEEINKLLYELACQGLTVVRLHGGDPYVFGRGEEECMYLRERGVDCAVVPGITSAIAGPAYAGIPVTSRYVASSFAVVTGREAEGKKQRIDYAAIASAVDTLVILMGVGRLEVITSQLLEAGIDPETPVAIVENATTPGQRVVIGTLKNIAVKAREAGIAPPAVIVIGRVVELREKLWRLS
ncbi:uroporphyrinogen-III C-methyltransferase [Hyperthermus butylicus]|uniref:uroporphyrinogen-III C-methyltransferase n=1 Tax=Hyperthermus butylicus (strain DSM 5456 / JCM 9403 / PLM1-5) TaxID=415426 RepID=A2BL25_HYPBU|nr:uroporphyrinogen-III C-methyltransferase [Hyperthermus butylicus]ABM80686.1 Uroporphyrin-III C-methyltransferase [Hyperthermus butylicus DSM 5456]